MPASTVRKPPVLASIPVMSVSATATRKRAMRPRPAWRSTRMPASVVATIRAIAQSQPTIATTMKKTAISATGRSRMLMIAHFTMAVFPPADVVGVGAGIVYGLAEAQVFSSPGLQSLVVSN